MSREEFSSYWKTTHAPILKEIPGLRGYVQNHARLDSEGNEPPCHGFGELYFDSLESMQAGLASSQGEATLADIPNFCDTEKFVRVFVDEVKFLESTSVNTGRRGRCTNILSCTRITKSAPKLQGVLIPFCWIMHLMHASGCVSIVGCGFSGGSQQAMWSFGPPYWPLFPVGWR
jgi:uncharacterized protein (TIGR02118 family)